MELAVLTQDPNPLDVTTLVCANPFLAWLPFHPDRALTTDKPTIASSCRPKGDSLPKLARVHDPTMCSAA